MNDYKKYLVPSVIARLSNMELKAKFIVQGFIAGLHKSPYRGLSVEFAEHRQYAPGDDLKNLDWKVFARTEKYFVKQFEEDTNLKSYILLDISKSMSFSSKNSAKKPLPLKKTFLEKLFGKENAAAEENPAKGISKLEYASYLAASLAYLILQQKDAISLTTFDTKVRNHIRPHATNSNLRQILAELENLKSTNQTGIAPSLNEMAEKIKRRGLVIIISDLLDEQNEVLNALKHFRYKKNDVIVFQILDTAEINFIEGNPVTMVDIETGEEMFSQPNIYKNAYTEAFSEFVKKYKKECTSINIDFLTLSTETPFDRALLTYLEKRAKAL